MSAEPPARSAWAPRLRRLGRYAVTSVVATVISETTLLLLYGAGVLGGGSSAVVASLAGTVPSYLMSRYWIWPEADRRHVARQATAYWITALVSLVLSGLGTAAAARLAPPGHTAHMVVVGVCYVGIYGSLWLAKFVLYQGVLFRPAREPDTEKVATAGAESSSELTDVTL